MHWLPTSTQGADGDGGGDSGGLLIAKADAHHDAKLTLGGGSGGTPKPLLAEAEAQVEKSSAAAAVEMFVLNGKNSDAGTRAAAARGCAESSAYLPESGAQHCQPTSKGGMAGVPDVHRESTGQRK